MRKAPKVMPRTAASPSPRSAMEIEPSAPSHCKGVPFHPYSHPSPTLTVGQPPAVLHRHLQDLLKDGVVL